MTSITNSGCDIIKQELSLDNSSTIDTKVSNYDIESTSQWIEENNFQRVGLQFPDELLPVSIAISGELKRRVTGCQFGIMADTSYSSCCVDTASAEHFSVDAIVHYGAACLTAVARAIPVRYVFGEPPVDRDRVEQAAQAIETHCRSIGGDNEEEDDRYCMWIVADLRHSLFGGALAEELASRTEGGSVCVHRSRPNYPRDASHTSDQNDQSTTGYVSIGSRLIEAPCDNRSGRRSVVFIGDDIDHSVQSILVTVRWNQGLDRSRLFVLSPRRPTVLVDAAPEIERVLKARRHSIAVARAARRVGLLVASLSADRLVDGYERLRGAMRARGKLVYPLVVGRINPNKLANFSDLDCLVALGCPMSALEFCRRSARTDDFYRPLVTPFEMACACADPAHPLASSDPLHDRYVIDFRDLLGELAAIEARGPDGADDRDAAESAGHALVPRLDSQWSVSSIDRSTRSWFGLDPQMGQTEVALVTEGRFGVAAGYRDELDLNK